MVDSVRIINLALQAFGSRTTITAAELANNSTNEAIQANLTFGNTRDGLLRMAPWGCGMNTANLTYITSVPGTMENTSSAPTLWQRGLPRPPWAYEYQYPADCLRACWIIPSSQTGFTGIPITTAVTGNTPTTWLGGPITFVIGVDQFYYIYDAIVQSGGIGYAFNDIITLASGPAPFGAPAKIRVLTVDGAGVILEAAIVSQFPDSEVPVGGSYFAIPLFNAQGSTTGSGTGAIFNIEDVRAGPSDQRVILTNQEYATLVYVRQVIDPNVWDAMFQDAMTNALGADLCMALTGDKALANGLRGLANNSIAEARKADGNEGLTINDVTPDWIRIRGIDFNSQYLGQGNGFDWGGFLPLFS